MGRHHSPRIVTDELILCLDAANKRSYPGSGTIWTDLSGLGNNGVLINGPSYSGDSGGIISFDGNNDYMKATMNSPYLDGDPTFSVSMFVRRRIGTNIGGNAGFWGIGGTGQRNSIEGWTPTANLIHFDTYDSTRLSSGQSYPEGQFIHLVWTKNGAGTDITNVKCYINGTEFSLVKTREPSGTNHLNTTVSDTGICLGRIVSDENNYHCPIDIGVFNIYKKVLTSDEVKQNFNALRGRYGI